MRAAMMLVVTLAPVVFARRGLADREAIRTRRLDGRDVAAVRDPLASDVHGARRRANDDVGDRADEQSRQAAPVVGADDQQRCLDVGRGLHDAVPRGVDAKVRVHVPTDPLREVARDLLHVLLLFDEAHGERHHTGLDAADEGDLDGVNDVDLCVGHRLRHFGGVRQHDVCDRRAVDGGENAGGGHESRR